MYKQIALITLLATTSCLMASEEQSSSAPSSPTTIPTTVVHSTTATTTATNTTAATTTTTTTPPTAPTTPPLPGGEVAAHGTKRNNMKPVLGKKGKVQGKVKPVNPQLEFYVNATCTFGSWKQRALAALIPGYYPSIKAVKGRCESGALIDSLQKSLRNLTAYKNHLTTITKFKTAATAVLSYTTLGYVLSRTTGNRGLLTFGAAALCSAIAYGINKACQNSLCSPFETQYLQTLADAIKADAKNDDAERSAARKKHIFETLNARKRLGAAERQMLATVRQLVDNSSETAAV